jgi:aspartate/methionine/tyrosine aminotransferase
MSESQRLRAVQTPIIPVIADLIRAHPGTISLGQGVVGYGPPPEVHGALARFFAAPANHKYQPVAGCAFLLEEIARTLTREHALTLDPAPHGTRAMVTAGGNNAFLAALLAIADPGDEVILPTPYYFNHEMAIVMSGCRPVLVPTDAAHQLDLDALRAAIGPRTRAIVTVSPNNPTGAVYPAEALQAVNALCAEHGVFHLSDEAYAHFTHDGAAHFSPATLPGAGAHTISLFSLSKSHGFASWRIGWLVYPARLEAALRKIQDTVLICPPVVSQYAAAAALAVGGDWVRAQLGPLRAARTLVQSALAPLIAEGGCEVPAAQGAFYFLLRLPAAAENSGAPVTSLALAERLIREHRVAAIPGSAFGPERGRTLRLAYGALDPATAPEALARLTRGLRALR